MTTGSSWVLPKSLRLRNSGLRDILERTINRNWWRYISGDGTLGRKRPVLDGGIKFAVRTLRSTQLSKIVSTRVQRGTTLLNARNTSSHVLLVILAQLIVVDSFEQVGSDHVLQLCKGDMLVTILINLLEQLVDITG